MSKIDELIQQYCPNGVVFKTLGEVAFYAKERLTVSGIGSDNYVGVDNLLPNKQGKTASDYTPSSGSFIRYDIDDILIGNIRPYLKKIWRATNSGGTNGDVLVIRINSDMRDRITPEFLYYHLSSDSFFEYDTQYSKGAKMPRGDKAAVMRYAIPLPPLPVQAEIVNILDKFTALEAELEAELDARRAQYEYYRDKLLSFNDLENWGGYNLMALGEIGTLIRGNGLQKKDFVASGIGCIHYGQIYTHYGTFAHKTKTFVSPDLAKKLKKANMGDLVIATTSENVEDVCKAVAWLGDEDIAVSGDAYIFRHNQNAKYLAYYLQTPVFFDYKKRVATGTKVTRVSGNSMAKFKIPVPSLAEQSRIVSILDRFDLLVNDLSVGLPAELAARRQQYEHYRNRLLTFAPVGVGAS